MKTPTPAEIHALNVKKGFWDEPRTIEHCAMLVITELSEAVEADRKGRRVKNIKETKEYIMLNHSVGGVDYELAFEAAIEGTVEEELADCVIRLWDYMRGFNLYGESAIIQDWYSEECKNKTFAENCFVITKCLTKEPEKPFLCAYNIFILAERMNIDLPFFIWAKFEYNKTRGHKHGKKY